MNSPSPSIQSPTVPFLTSISSPSHCFLAPQLMPHVCLHALCERVLLQPAMAETEICPMSYSDVPRVYPQRKKHDNGLQRYIVE